MPVLSVLLVLGVFAFMWWRHRTTTLSRDCRWRRNGAGGWLCAFCGAQAGGNKTPRDCLRNAR